MPEGEQPQTTRSPRDRQRRAQRERDQPAAQQPQQLDPQEQTQQQQDQPAAKQPPQLDPQQQPQRLLRDLRSTTDGLSEREAQRRLAQYGPNAIRRREGAGHLRELARQLTHPLAALLWVAAALALLSANAPLAIAIVAVIVLNAIFAYMQELQAERATEALAEMLPQRARVRRAGRPVEIGAERLVPGDVLLIGEGDRLCADARMLSGSLEVDMSALTGESQPATRAADRSRHAGGLLEAEDLLFSGTLCIAGQAQAVVYATGMHTQLGRIAALSQRLRGEISPLQAQVNRAAQLIAVVALGAGAVFLLLGVFAAALPVADALNFAIGLLVANVPEGLLPTITLALAVGVRRMARRRALLKRLTAVETLGSTDIICTDKTGTLTEGRMSVALLWCDGAEMTLSPAARPAAALPATPGEPFASLLRTAVRCNNATIARTAAGWRRKGDPSESALLIAAAELGLDVEAMIAERERLRRHAYSFDARIRLMSTLDAEGPPPRGDAGDEPDAGNTRNASGTSGTACPPPGGDADDTGNTGNPSDTDNAGTAPKRTLTLHTKGAPLEVLERCVTVRGRAGTRTLTERDRAAIAAAFERYAGRGLRVLAFAEADATATATGAQPPPPRERAEAQLCFIGLAALEDPPRADVPAAVARCRHAGIRIIVITGDHALTAEAVARSVGAVADRPCTLSGADIDAMGEAELERLLEREPELIVARSAPETKLHVVDALRARGHTVAMTGDGVNDAPALRRADIGVAMGATGTEVAREAAAMVLADDSFASIVAAVQEGRTVYENIRKFVTYIFAHTTPEVLPFLIYALAGGAVPLPITALQILAIDLGTETLPALALGREPAEPGLMDRPPRPREQGIIDRAILARGWGYLGLIEAALVMGGFFWVLLRAGWVPGAATGSGSALHHDYLLATTMTFAGITACQVGTAFATRTTKESLWSVGLLSNRLLLWGIAFELLFAAGVIYLPPLQSAFHTAALGLPELTPLLIFPFVVWGSDELRRWRLRRRAQRTAAGAAAASGTPAR